MLFSQFIESQCSEKSCRVDEDDLIEDEDVDEQQDLPRNKYNKNKVVKNAVCRNLTNAEKAEKAEKAELRRYRGIRTQREKDWDYANDFSYGDSWNTVGSRHEMFENDKRRSNKSNVSNKLSLSKYNEFSSCTIKNMDTNKLVNFGTFMKICGSHEARREFSSDEYEFMQRATIYAHKGKNQFEDFLDWCTSGKFDVDFKFTDRGAVVDFIAEDCCLRLTLVATPDNDLVNGL